MAKTDVLSLAIDTGIRRRTPLNALAPGRWDLARLVLVEMSLRHLLSSSS